MEIRTLLHGWRGWKRAQTLWKTVWQLHNMLKVELLYNLATPLLGVYIGEYTQEKQRHIYNVYLHAKFCTWMFVAALITTARK